MLKLGAVELGLWIKLFRKNAFMMRKTSMALDQYLGATWEGENDATRRTWSKGREGPEDWQGKMAQQWPDSEKGGRETPLPGTIHWIWSLVAQRPQEAALMGTAMQKKKKKHLTSKTVASCI